jgi:electron transfer flavoprotein alpha subunit
MDAEVHVLVAGHNGPVLWHRPLPRSSGVAKVIHADAEYLAHGLAENMAAQVLAIASNYSHILFPATASGKNIAPRVAAKLDVGQISDITKVIAADTFERPIYAGNAIATVQSTDVTKVITVRTTGFDPARPRLVAALPWKPRPHKPTAARAALKAARSPRATAPN